MPYTYDDFTRAAADAGLTGSFDQSDLDLAQKFPEFGLSLVSLRRDLNNAQTNEQRLLATEAANQLRKNYGSYGVGSGSNQTYASSYGSQIDKALEDIGSYGPFEYSRAGDYKGLLDRLINREAFSYDPGKDPIFSSYKKAYNREGDRAAANALAQSSATTGGRASSYANVAAQQAGNYYAAKLADMIPELRNQALTEYNNDYSQLLSAISTMGSDRDTEFGVYQDRLKQLQQNLANLQGQDASDYARFLDALNSAYQKERDAVADEQTAFENSLKIYQATGQITGPLADILGAGAGTGIGTGGTGGGAGGYRGSRSGNTPTAADAAAQEEINNILDKWGYSSITGEPYRDSNGNLFMNIGSWDEYQRLKELGNWTDAELNQAGIRYGYPTTTDANGNLTPAVAYTPVGGTPQTWEQVDAAGGNYQAMVQRLQQLKDSGASKAEVLEDIRAFYQAGQITSSDYQRLYNQYRNMNASEFGTGAATTTPSTSGRSTGAGTVKPGTRTPSTASTTPSTPAYDSRGIPWAYSPDNPANKSSGTTKSTASTTPSTSTSSSTTKTTGSGLLSSLVSALQSVANKANTNPYAGYNVDPVTNANMNGSSNKSTSSSSTKSTSSTKSSSSSSSKTSGTVKAGTRTPSTTSTTTKKTTTTTTKKTASGGGGAKRVAATR